MLALTRTRLWAFALFLLVLIFLYFVRSILTPFILAAITAYVLYPAAAWLEGRLGISHRYVAIALFVGLLSGIIVLIVVLVPILVHQTIQLAREAPRTLAQIRTYLSAYDSLDVLGIPIDVRVLQRATDNLMAEVANLASREAIPAVFHAAELIIKTFVYLVTTFYLLLQGRDLVRSILDLVPETVQPDLRFLAARINRTLSFYVRGQIMLIGIMSAATTIALTALQVKYALLLGITTGILETIPIIGPITAGTFAVLIALVQGSTPFNWSPVTLAAVVALVYFVLRQTEDNLVIPLIIGRMVDLHPVLVIFSAMAGATVGGLLGLLLAIPAAAVAKIVIEYAYPKATGRRSSVTLSVAPGDKLATFLQRLWNLPLPEVTLLIPASSLEELESGEGRQAFIDTVKALHIRPTFVTDHPVVRQIALHYGWKVE